MNRPETACLTPNALVFFLCIFLLCIARVSPAGPLPGGDPGQDPSDITIQDGDVVDEVDMESGKVTMTGGEVLGQMVIQDQSTLDISGGKVDGRTQIDLNSTMNMTGGRISNLLVSNYSVANISGGYFHNIYETYFGQVNLYGRNLHDVVFQPTEDDKYWHIFIYGRLLDGTDISGAEITTPGYRDPHYNIYNIPVPESGSVAALAVILCLSFPLIKKRCRK